MFCLNTIKSSSFLLKIVAITAIYFMCIMTSFSSMASDDLYHRLLEDKDLYQSLEAVNSTSPEEGAARLALVTFADNLSWVLASHIDVLEKISCSTLLAVGQHDIDCSKSNHQSIGVTGAAIILAGIAPWQFDKKFSGLAVADIFRIVFINNSEKIVTIVSNIKTVNNNNFTKKGVFGKNFRYPENETQIMKKKNGLLEISKVCHVVESLTPMNLSSIPKVEHIKKALPNTSFRDLAKWKVVKTNNGKILEATVNINKIEQASVELALEYVKNKVDANSSNTEENHRYFNDTFFIRNIKMNVTTFSSEIDSHAYNDLYKSQVINSVKSYFSDLKFVLCNEAISTENRKKELVNNVTCKYSTENLSYVMTEARFIAMWLAATEVNLQTVLSICGAILYSMSSSINITNGIAEQISRFNRIAASMKGNDEKGFLHATCPYYLHPLYLEEQTKTCLNNIDDTLLVIPPLANKLQRKPSQKTQNTPFRRHSHIIR